MKEFNGYQSRENKILGGALDKIGEANTAGALSQLCQYRHHPDPQIRVDVAFNLGEIADRQAIKYLIELCGDDDTNVVIEAANALTTYDYHKIEPYLVPILNKTDSRKALNLALDIIRDNKLNRAEILNPVLQLHKNDSVYIQQRVVECLAAYNDTDLLQFWEQILLQSVDSYQCAIALQCAAEISQQPDIVFLEKYLIHPNIDIRKHAFYVLGCIDASQSDNVDRAINRLLDTLVIENNDEIIEAILTTLEGHNHPSIASGLATFIHRKNWPQSTLLQVLYILAHINTPKANAILCQLATHKNRKIQDEAKQILRHQQTYQ